MKKILLLAFTMFLFSTNVFAEETSSFIYDFGEKNRVNNCMHLPVRDNNVGYDIPCQNDKEYIRAALTPKEENVLDAKKITRAEETERTSILQKIKDKVSQCANGSLSLFELGDVEECQEIILGNFCDNKKTDSKIAGKKCENKTKIAKSINEKFLAYLTIPAVKDVCKKILIEKKVETSAVKIDGIKTSYIRKCRRGAKKYERLEKRAKNVDGKSDKKLAETKCLAKADFKKIDKCIKKVKIQYKLNSDYAQYLVRPSVKDACKEELVKNNKITDSYQDTFALRDLRKCQRSVKKMKRFTKKAEKNKKADSICLGLSTLAKVKSCVKDFVKAKKICKKLKRKLKKCEGDGCVTEPSCETIESQGELKEYETQLKKVKTIITTDRKENRTKKIENVKNKFKKKKKTK